MNLFFVVHSHPSELIHLCFVFVSLSPFNSWPSHVLITNIVFKDRHWADFITLLKTQKANVASSRETVVESCNNSSTKPTRWETVQCFSVDFKREEGGRKDQSHVKLMQKAGSAAVSTSCCNCQMSLWLQRTALIPSGNKELFFTNTGALWINEIC